MKILAVTAIVLVFTIAISDYVYAHHYSGYRWLLTYTSVCYDSYSLSLVKIDNSTGRFSLVASELDHARNDWNNLPSVFTINRVNSCNNWVTSGHVSGESFIARVIPTIQLGYLVDADMEINRAHAFASGEKCPRPLEILDAYTLDYVARHEFGHYVMFSDVSFLSPMSTMFGNYDCSRYRSVQSYDSNELSRIYG